MQDWQPRALLPHQLSLGRIIACIHNLYSKVTLLLLCTCSCQLPYWHQGDLFWLFSLPVLCFGSVHLTSHPQQARTAITTTRNLRRSIRTMIVAYLQFHNLGWDTSLKPSKMNHSNHFHNLGCDTFPAKAKSDESHSGQHTWMGTSSPQVCDMAHKFNWSTPQGPKKRDDCVSIANFLTVGETKVKLQDQIICRMTLWVSPHKKNANESDCSGSVLP